MNELQLVGGDEDHVVHLSEALGFGIHENCDSILLHFDE